MSVFDNVVKRFSDLKEVINLKDDDLKYLLEPKLVSQTELDVDGEKFSAWRIVSNRALGPGKGGIRFHPDVCEDEVKSLAFWMSLKNSLLGLPYGGAKGGIKFNPKERDAKFLEKISRKYIDAFYNVLGQDKDIPAPDVYTNPQTMAWMLDQYEKNVGHHEPGMITGKPIELGGIALRGDSTAKGAYLVILEMVKTLGLKDKELTVAVQGFGNAGLNIAKMLFADNFKIVAVNDSKGGVYNQEGIDINELIKFKEEYGLVSSFAEYQAVSNDELLEMDVDILILSALENQITTKNADKIKAKHIVEIANGPVDYDADKILFSKGITVVPDILANAGGVLVSYFEWSQNRTGNILDENYLAGLLNERMIKSWYNVYNKYLDLDKKVDLRKAAYIIALERIIKAEKLRGNL
ncbi:glutamate dehydrogenase [Candidatus Falkowbacteria bacterium HGW-Falkowbacteria-1]|uniref:Glutamate dehydrogenase n=1 Tax=Candidatus Falkowbacteria bacterium HGW-Falkowbacteria-1 TaxID=2013768 RepID=A0A2N2EA65_9BACT|nr:MAG: glutamate dehydrogenase [Candidatus Falkowbacteria bacterium HGW-Falkowbacteria-1]